MKQMTEAELMKEIEACAKAIFDTYIEDWDSGVSYDELGEHLTLYHGDGENITVSEDDAEWATEVFIKDAENKYKREYAKMIAEYSWKAIEDFYVPTSEEQWDSLEKLLSDLKELKAA